MSESHQAGTPTVRSTRDLLKVWGPAVVITLAGFVAAWQYVDPAPPKSLRIASGSSEGAYYQHATRYRELLAEHGITLEVIETAGSTYWQEDAIRFTVSDTRYTAGVANLQAQVSVRRLAVG